MKSRIALFIFALILWFLLSWSVDVPHIILGVVTSIIVAALTGDLFTKNPHKFIKISRYFWFIVYIPVFAWAMLKANIDVAIRLLSPKLPINPGVVKIKTKLKSETGITFLCNSITLTPGTTTVDVDKENGYIYVHWLNCKTQDPDEAAKQIAEKYEKILIKVFD